MKPDEALRILRMLRFSPQAGRPISFAWIAAQTGYDSRSLHRAIQRGSINQRMTDRLEPALNLVRQVLEARTRTVLKENIGKMEPGPIGGRDARGTWGAWGAALRPGRAHVRQENVPAPDKSNDINGVAPTAPCCAAHGHQVGAAMRPRRPGRSPAAGAQGPGGDQGSIDEGKR